MKHSRIGTPGLKHLAFFERLADAQEETPRYRVAVAGLLTLRLLDHWTQAGAVMVEPESVSVRSVRNAIMAIPANDPQREVLLGLVNTMQTLREVDVHPVLPRLFAYAQMLEKRAEFSLAVDTYRSIIRLGQEQYEPDLAIDSHMNLAYCLRMSGDLDAAEAAYTSAGQIAKRHGASGQLMRSRTKLALVVMARGNLPRAEELLTAVQDDIERAGCTTEFPAVLIARAAVAQRRGRLNHAVSLAYDALTRSESPAERDFILADIAAFLITLKRFDAARDALLILDVTTVNEGIRMQGRMNLVALAARTADRELFYQAREQLVSAPLAVETKVNFLIESARGFRQFGDEDRALESLKGARALALLHGLNRSVFEAEELLTSRVSVVHTQADETLECGEDLAAHVVVGLRRMAAELAT